MEYFNYVEVAQGIDGDYEFHTATASKSAEQAVRIAGVITIFGNEKPKQINLESMKMGIEIAQWYLEESLMLDGEMSISESHRNASKLLDWLKNYEQDNEAPLKLSDLLQIGPRCIRTKQERDAAVDTL